MKRITQISLYFAFSFCASFALSQSKADGKSRSPGVDLQAKSGPLAGKTIYNNSFALIVGINKYEHLREDWLEYAVDDAKDIREILIRSYGFRPSNIVMLLDEKAKKQNILDALSSITNSQRVGENDRVLVYFAGHGKTLKLPGTDMGFLLPYDARVDLKQTNNPEDYLKTCIKMRDIWDIMDASSAKHFLLMADACFSGLMAKSREALEPLNPDALAQTAQFPARQVLTAGRKGEKSFENSSHGVFTGKVLQWLKFYAMEPGQVLSARELHSKVVRSVANATNGNQNPQFANYGDYDGDFLFISTAPYDPSIKPAAAVPSKQQPQSNSAANSSETGATQPVTPASPPKQTGDSANKETHVTEKAPNVKPSSEGTDKKQSARSPGRRTRTDRKKPIRIAMGTPPNPAPNAGSATSNVATAVGGAFKTFKEIGEIPLIPAKATLNGQLTEADLQGLISRAYRWVDSPKEGAVTPLRQPVTRIRALAALEKLCFSPDEIKEGLTVPAEDLPPDIKDAGNMQRYVMYAVAQVWWPAHTKFDPNGPATWTFVATLLEKMPLAEGMRTQPAAPVSQPKVEPAASDKGSKTGAAKPADTQKQPANRPALPSSESGAFTGLILDARGLAVDRAEFVKILDTASKQIYPDPAAIPSESYLHEKGLVDYIKSEDMAKRAGKRPLMIEVEKMDGINIVVSVDNGQKIIDADAKGRFIRSWRVCLLKDE